VPLVRTAAKTKEGGREGTNLIVGGVDGFAHELVQRLEARQNDGGIGALLDRAVAEANEVGANADRTPHDELEGREAGGEGGREEELIFKANFFSGIYMKHVQKQRSSSLSPSLPPSLPPSPSR